MLGRSTYLPISISARRACSCLLRRAAATVTGRRYWRFTCERRAVRDRMLPGGNRLVARLYRRGAASERDDWRRAPPDGFRPRSACSRCEQYSGCTSASRSDRGRGEILLKWRSSAPATWAPARGEVARLAGSSWSASPMPIARGAEELARRWLPGAAHWRQRCPARRPRGRGADRAHLEVAGACLDAPACAGRKASRSTSRSRTGLLAPARKGVVLQVGHVERYNAAFGALAARMAKRSTSRRAAVGIQAAAPTRRGARPDDPRLDLALSLAKGR